jgi:hypothetical protein
MKTDRLLSRRRPPGVGKLEVIANLIENLPTLGLETLLRRFLISAAINAASYRNATSTLAF